MTDVNAQFFYGYRQDYGKNRVQFTEMNWSFYRFERFDVYYYASNKKVAQQVARITNQQLSRLESILDAPIEDRIQILLFTNLSELKESNVNQSTDEAYNAGGVTRVSGGRLFVYFDGDYVSLENQIQAALTDALLSNLFTGSFAESIRNSYLLNLPEWFTEGLVSFIAHDFDANADVIIRDGYLSKEFEHFNSLVGPQARYAGYSFWYFISEVYGRRVIKDIVYISMINRNIESGFLYVLGKDIEQIFADYENFYDEKYRNFTMPNDELDEEVLRKARKNREITRLDKSDDSKYLAYVELRFGEYRIYLHNLEKDRRKRIYKGGYKIAQNRDFSFPLLAWHPNSEILAFFTEEKGYLWLNFYQVKEKKIEKKKFFKFDKILSFDYSMDGKEFVLSAVKNGRSDIFIYNILNTKIKQITNDDYTDLNPTFIMDDKRVAFASNREEPYAIDDKNIYQIKNRHFDLYSARAVEMSNDSNKLWQLTNSAGIDEVQPREYADGYLSFLSNRSGTQNRHLIKIDSSIAYVDTITHYSYDFKEIQQTDFTRSVLGVAIDQENEVVYNIVKKDKRFKIVSTPYEDPERLSFKNLLLREDINMSKDRNVVIDPSASDSQMPLFYPGVKASEFEVNIHDFNFNERSASKDTSAFELPDFIVQEGPAKDENPIQKREILEIPPSRNYFLSFYQDDFTIRFDNTFDNPQYQPFSGFVSSDYLNTGFNMQLKVGVMDLMHDYRIVAGLRTNFQPLAGTSIAPNAEFIIALIDNKERLDKTYMLNRRSQVTFFENGQVARQITHELTTKYSWPLSPVASFKGDFGYRITKTIGLSRDPFSLEFPDSYSDYIFGRAAYVYDNARNIGLNLNHGFKFKAFTEYYRNLRTSESGMYTAGIDMRNYTKVHRNMIWANRLAAGTSWGQEKLIYFMGGTDNSFSADFEPTTPIANENYAFQTLVTNMRGLFQNVRNGNNFVVVNSELRLPLFSYFSKRPLKSDFIQNFQIIAFGDFGTAWNGPSPYSNENAINTITKDFGNLEIVLDSQKDPFVGGFGTGIRSRLFGYYFRLDLAYGVEDGQILDRLWLFSIGTDF